MKLCKTVLALAAMISPFSMLQAEAFNNDSVVALTKAGLGDDVILSKIGSLPCSYRVSTDEIIKLRANGVSTSVIAAMVERCTGSSAAQGNAISSSDPSTMRPAGLYIDLDSSAAYQIQKIRPTMGSGGRMTGNGSLLFPFRVKMGIPREAAQTKAASATPEFYFYFEPDDGKVGDFGTSATISAQSPSEFSLVRFKLKDGQREMVVGKQQAFGAKVGIDPKDAIQFTVEELSDGIFKVVTAKALEPGEYGFVLKSGSDAYRIYDFSVG